MPFKVGEEVKFLNEEGGGVIVEILNNGRVLVCDDHGFEIEVKKSDLVSRQHSVVDEDEIRLKVNAFDVQTKDAETGAKGYVNYVKIMGEYLMKSKPHWTRKDKDFVEIDLHIEELAEKPKSLSDGQKLQLQLDYARHCMDAAREMGLKRLIFIHGIGEGVLKHELHKWFIAEGDLQVVQGRFTRYGGGATEVNVKGLHST
jgi:dsDNA-specific endonuclease/ATPase MutS2